MSKLWDNPVSRRRLLGGAGGLLCGLVVMYATGLLVSV
jgi:hypothetical protein